jgi:nitrite reductase/ring-hydroxylating ferredoxin subunit/multimeric flavodoxin WrbA
MDKPEQWHDVGTVAELQARGVHAVTVGRTKVAVTFVDGKFGVISGVCNHVGGPLGEGRLDGEYVVCPWHQYKYHCRTGKGEPGFEADAVPSYALKEEGGRLWVSLEGATKRSKPPHAPHPLERPIKREPGPVRVVGISTTVMDEANPRYSTSEALLATALAHARAGGAEERLLRLNELQFRACEGYYSKSAHACTWPCSITQMDASDQMDRVYEAVVFWADVVLLATPIRWGAASSLYYKMIERMNCIQNQVTIRDRVMLRNKVAAFIITGGQDNVQGVVGQLLTFFGELGYHFPQFPFVAHSRGWSAEDMENNVAYVRGDRSLHDGARALADRAVETAKQLLGAGRDVAQVERAGRKAFPAHAGPRTADEMASAEAAMHAWTGAPSDEPEGTPEP